MTPDEGTVRTFQEEGVVVLRALFREWIEPLAAGVARVMANPSALERSVQPSDGTAAFFQDLCNWSRVAELRAFVYESPAAAVAAALMGSREARFFHDHVLVKRAGTSTVTPWHHDEPYYCIRASQSVSFWTPLDPVARSVSLECIAGSHRWSASGFRPTRFNGTALYERDEFEPMPDIEARRERLTIRSWALEPGDAIAFHFRTVHGAPANRSAIPRRVFSSRWVGEDARFARRSGPTSPPFPHLALEDGASLDVADFPIIYRG